MRAWWTFGLASISTIVVAAVGCGEEFVAEPPTGGASSTAGAGGSGDTGGTSSSSGGGLVGGGGSGAAGGSGAGSPLGEPCEEGSECESGFCTDGVCCELEACPGECHTCNRESGTPGHCQPAEPLTDPHDDCAEPGQCDGSGMCAVGTGDFQAVYGSAGTDVAYGVAATPDGGAVVVGSFQGFFTCSTPSLESAGDEDVFVARLQPNGAVAWCRGFGDIFAQRALGVAVDAQGDITVVGWYSGQIDFDPDSTAYELPSVGANHNAFVARFDDTGELIWSRGATPGAGPVEARAVAVASNGDAFVAGSYTALAQFGGGPLTNTDGLANPFLLRLGADTGANVFVVGFDSLGHDDALAVTVDANDQPVVGGVFTNTLNIGSTLVGDSVGDGFVARVNALNGAPISAVALEGEGRQAVTGVAPLLAGEVAVLGEFTNTVSLGVESLEAVAFSDVFVARLRPDWSPAWGVVLGSTGAETAGGIATDHAGNVVVIGSYADDATFAEALTLENRGGTDVFVAKMAVDGTPLWAHGYGDAQLQSGYAVATGSERDIWVTGSFAGTLEFFSPGLVANSSQDVFVARLTP